jgi:ketosteroid isomerase-like protein
MSQENVEVVEAANAALNRGDLESAWDSFAPDAEMQDLLSGPDQPTVVKGRAAIQEVWGLWMGAFDELRADVEQYVDAGDAVICASHWIGHGKASGISIDVRQFDVYELRDEQIVRATLGYKSKAEALEAVGLSEQAG